MGEKHKELCRKAIEWLYKRNCSIFANEVPTWNGIADAVGVITNQRPFREDTVYYIEAKASMSDLLCSKQKCCVRRTEEIEGYKNDVDFFYFIISDNMKVDKGLYPNWGVIDERGSVIRRAKRHVKTEKSNQIITDISHVLVYKVFGKLYLL